MPVHVSVPGLVLGIKRRSLHLKGKQFAEGAISLAPRLCFVFVRFALVLIHSLWLSSYPTSTPPRRAAPPCLALYLVILSTEVTLYLFRLPTKTITCSIGCSLISFLQS